MPRWRNLASRSIEAPLKKVRLHSSKQRLINFDLRRLFKSFRTQIYLTRWKRVLSDMVLEMYCDRFERYTDLVFSRFGGDLLSHVLRHSTISATALNGRVRNGAGCFARAMATKPRKYQIQVKHLCVYAF